MIFQLLRQQDFWKRERCQRLPMSINMCWKCIFSKDVNDPKYELEAGKSAIKTKRLNRSKAKTCSKNHSLYPAKAELSRKTIPISEEDRTGKGNKDINCEFKSNFEVKSGSATSSWALDLRSELGRKNYGCIQNRSVITQDCVDKYINIERNMLKLWWRPGKEGFVLFWVSIVKILKTGNDGIGGWGVLRKPKIRLLLCQVATLWTRSQGI